MDGIPPTYPSSYPPPPIPVPAEPGYGQQYNHVGQQYADAHYAGQYGDAHYAGQYADAHYAGQHNPPPAAAAAATDPPNISYGYPQPPHPPPKADPQIIIQNTTVVNSEPGCECGIGWILFGVGWFIYVTWIVGAIMYCIPHKPKNKGGLLGCLIMSIIGAVFIVIAVASNRAS